MVVAYERTSAEYTAMLNHVYSLTPPNSQSSYKLQSLHWSLAEWSELNVPHQHLNPKQ